MSNMTALMSAFAREYILEEEKKSSLLYEKERNSIMDSLYMGKDFFCPGFAGSREEIIERIVKGQLAPSVVARKLFLLDALKMEKNLGLMQLVQLGAGFDNLSYQDEVKGLTSFEVDFDNMIEERRKRAQDLGREVACTTNMIGCDIRENLVDQLISNGFNTKAKSMGVMMGLTYYLTNDENRKLLKTVGSIFSKGSAICFDYQMKQTGESAEKNRNLASEAGEEMKSSFSYHEMQKMMEECGFLIYEHMDNDDADRRFLKKYDMKAPSGVGYVLAVTDR